MDQNDPSRRQYAQNPYVAQQTPQEGGQQPGQYNTSASNERFRQSSFLQQSPTASSPAGRAGGEGQQVYGYQQALQYGTAPSMQTSAMPYAQSFQAQDSQRQAQQPSYQTYGGQSMYGMAQQQAQQTQPSASTFSQTPQYRQRPSTGSETFTAQFGVPQNAQYYAAGQQGPTSAPIANLAAQQMPSQYQQLSYPQPGQSIPQPYPGAMADPSQPAIYSAFGPQSQYGQQQPATSVDQAFDEYTRRIKGIFTMVREGTLRDVGQQLLNISQYLLGNAEVIGLTRDDAALHDDRIRLWDEFNQAWLTALQRQYDMVEAMTQVGQQLPPPQSVMSSQTLEQLSRELVRLCDSAEPFGLVDYQMGVAEEEIMDLLLRCLSLMESTSGTGGEAAHAEPSASAATRGRQ